MKTVGEQAREFRLARGWNTLEMATAVSRHHPDGPVSRQVIEQLEKAGARRPRYMAALAKTMGTTVEVLEVGAFSVSADETHIPSHEDDEGQGFKIQQFDTGGAMGHGVVLRDQPGVIQSWTVSDLWLQQNVHRITAAKNLCIVTGFGPSMQPLYNPGDPLLVDRGVQRVDVDGIYFFRVGTEGFVKQLQRIPTAAGLVIRAKSYNTLYDPFDISDGMDFEVFGRVVKAWRGEEF